MPWAQVLALLLSIGLIQQLKYKLIQPVWANWAGSREVQEAWDIASTMMGGPQCAGGVLQRAAVLGGCLPPARSAAENKAHAWLAAHGSEPAELSEGCPDLCSACQGFGTPVDGLWHTGQSACPTHPPAVHTGGTLLVHSGMAVLPMQDLTGHLFFFICSVSDQQCELSIESSRKVLLCFRSQLSVLGCVAMHRP